jgi:hypothetical protein
MLLSFRGYSLSLSRSRKLFCRPIFAGEGWRPLACAMMCNMHTPVVFAMTPERSEEEEAIQKKAFL